MPPATKPRQLSEVYPSRLFSSVYTALLGSAQAGYQVAVLNTAGEHVLASAPHAALHNLRASAALLGAVIGALLARPISNGLGRRSAQILSGCLYLAGSCLAAGVWWSPCFLIGRILAGIGAGANSVHVYQYISEILPQELREGSVKHLHQVFFSVGVLAAMLIGLPYDNGVDAVQLAGLEVFWWQIMVGGAAAPALLQIVCLWSCPESPAWLEAVDKDKADEACIALWGSRAILYEDPGTPAPSARGAATLRLSHDAHAQAPGGNSFDKLEQLAADLHRPSWDSEALMAALLGDEADAAVTEQWWRTAFRYEYRRVMLLALGLPVLVQASGGASVLLFSSQIFPQLACPNEVPAAWGSVAVGLTFLAATAASSAASQRAGRRVLLLASFLGMSVCLFTCSVITYVPGVLPGGVDAATGRAGAAASAAWMPCPQAPGTLMALHLVNSSLVVLHTAFYALGSGPVLWQYLDEILTPHIKGPVTALASALSWATALVVALTFLPAIDGLMAIGGNYLVYGLFAVLGLVLVAIAAVESKGRTQAELEDLLLRHPKPRLRNLFPANNNSPQGPGSAPSASSPARAESSVLGAAAPQAVRGAVGSTLSQSF